MLLLQGTVLEMTKLTREGGGNQSILRWKMSATEVWQDDMVIWPDYSFPTRHLQTISRFVQLSCSSVICRSFRSLTLANHLVWSL